MKTFNTQHGVLSRCEASQLFSPPLEESRTPGGGGLSGRGQVWPLSSLRGGCSQLWGSGSPSDTLEMPMSSVWLGGLFVLNKPGGIVTGVSTCLIPWSTCPPDTRIPRNGPTILPVAQLRAQESFLTLLHLLPFPQSLQSKHQ